ncbi:MAG: hypothetical protein FWD42_08030, partial [Solirubrobacterales bacterium]|nr:hypothetical protein [Solirubrobacterales bacterium]
MHATATEPPAVELGGRPVEPAPGRTRRTRELRLPTWSLVIAGAGALCAITFIAGGGLNLGPTTYV